MLPDSIRLGEVPLLLSLPFLPLNIFFGAGRSLQFCLLIDMVCKGPFSEHFQIYRLQLSTLCRLLFIPVFSSHFLSEA